MFGMMKIPICLCAKFFKPLFRFKPMFHSQVGAKSFIIPNDKDIYCVPCFEDKVLLIIVKSDGDGDCDGDGDGAEVHTDIGRQFQSMHYNEVKYCAGLGFWISEIFGALGCNYSRCLQNHLLSS